MPTVTADTPRRAITVQGLTLQAPAPYAEGHQLSATEANVLNQTYSENLRNNFASQLQSKTKESLGKDATDEQVAAAIKGMRAEEVQGDFDAYASKYEFGVRVGGGGRSADPVERMMKEIAENRVSEALKAKGIQKSKLDKGVFSQRVEQFIAKYEPDLRKMAEKQVKDRAKLVTEDIGLEG